MTQREREDQSNEEDAEKLCVLYDRFLPSSFTPFISLSLPDGGSSSSTSIPSSTKVAQKLSLICRLASFFCRGPDSYPLPPPEMVFIKAWDNLYSSSQHLVLDLISSPLSSCPSSRPLSLSLLLSHLLDLSLPPGHSETHLRSPHRRQDHRLDESLGAVGIF
jgi:hypothetical protein